MRALRIASWAVEPLTAIAFALLWATAEIGRGGVTGLEGMIGFALAIALSGLLLVAKGLSNAEIAGSSLVEESTVKTHLAKILSKLALRSRVQVAVFAWEHGLVS